MLCEDCGYGTSDELKAGSEGARGQDQADVSPSAIL
jgi:hypothetical protein